MKAGLSQEQLDIRRGRFTGSTFAGLIGKSHWDPPSVWWKYQMGLGAKKTSRAMRYGNIFEEAIADAFQEELELGEVPRQQRPAAYTRRAKPGTVTHTTHFPWLVCHPDMVYWDAFEMAQIKRHDHRVSSQYGEPRKRGVGMLADNDLVPIDELIQCQIELECWASNQPPKERSKWRTIWLVVDFGGADVRAYRIIRDSAMIEALLGIGSQMWIQHMAYPGLPAPDDSAWQRWMDSGKAEEVKEDRPPPRLKLSTEDLNAAPIPKW